MRTTLGNKCAAESKVTGNKLRKRQVHFYSQHFIELIFLLHLATELDLNQLHRSQVKGFIFHVFNRLFGILRTTVSFLTFNTDGIVGRALYMHKQNYRQIYETKILLKIAEKTINLRYLYIKYTIIQRSNITYDTEIWVLCSWHG